MRTFQLDRDTADRMLAGRVAPDDAPPGYADLARLVAAVSAPPAPRELTRQEEDVEAAAAIRSPGPSPASAPRGPSRRRTRFARVRTVTLVAAGTVIATSGLAAAGVLPDPVQDVVSDVLSRVGIAVPAGEDDREGDDPPSDPDAPVSPVAVVPEAPPGDDPRVIPASPRERGHGPTGEHGRPDTPDQSSAGDGSAGSGDSEGANDEDHGNGPPEETPGNGPPEDPGAGPPFDTPRNGPPEDTPGNGPPADTPGNGPPADAGDWQGGPPPGHGN
jgi:hypothetical protein